MAEIKRIFRFVVGAFLAVLLSACATHQNKMAEPRRLLKQGQISSALEMLQPLAEQTSDDQLLYLLEYGTALQIAGKYKESNQAFLKADKLMDINDFHSVTNILGATLGSEAMIQYKGESYEKVLVNAMLAINYLMMNQPDDALVEARRLNEKLTKMRLDGRKPYELNPFAKYISALIWESEHKFDDAYIAFEEAYKLDTSNPYLPEDLLRASKMAKRDEVYKKWKLEFLNLSEDPSWFDKSLGELVIVYQQGWGPEKRNAPGQYRFPALYPVFSQTQAIKLLMSSPKGEKEEYKSKMIYNVSSVAIKTLQDDYGALVARRVGAYAAKAVVADQIRQKNNLLGNIAWIAMNISDQADLRQWSTLPAEIHLIKVRLKPGKYKITLQGVGGTGDVTSDSSEAEVVVSQGRKTFYNYRSLH